MLKIFYSRLASAFFTGGISYSAPYIHVRKKNFGLRKYIIIHLIISNTNEKIVVFNFKVISIRIYSDFEFVFFVVIWDPFISKHGIKT